MLGNWASWKQLKIWDGRYDKEDLSFFFRVKLFFFTKVCIKEVPLAWKIFTLLFNLWQILRWGERSHHIIFDPNNNFTLKSLNPWILESFFLMIYFENILSTLTRGGTKNPKFARFRGLLFWRHYHLSLFQGTTSLVKEFDISSFHHLCIQFYPISRLDCYVCCLCVGR